MSGGFAIDPATVRKWKRYPAYKDSGVEWLGEVPAGWEVIRSKFCTKINMGQSPSSEDCNLEERGIPFLQGTAEFGEVHPSPRQYCATPPKIALKDEILVSVRAPVGSLNIADQKYGIGRGLCSITPNRTKLKRSFTWYLLHHVREQLNCEAVGSTYDAVVADDVGNLVCPLPPLSEQQTIAAFLDRETARIDALITKKRRFIELLEEKRQTIISHAVTKGLDPKTEMKDSGVEWLGEIPKHWDVRKGRFLYRQLELPPNSNGEVVTAFRDGQVISREMRRTDGFTIAIKELGYQGVRKGDLVIHSMDGFAGAIGVSESDGKCTGEYVVCDPIQECNNHYFAACLRLMAIRGYIHAFCPSVRQRAPRFRFVRFKDVLLPVPPYNEQSEIVNHISTSTKILNELIGKNQKFIQMLLEFRTALISAAVTGKIDVRGEAPATP